MSVVLKEVGYVLIHVPSFVQYGSKPSRDLLDDNGLLKQIKDHLRTFEEVVRYPPHPPPDVLLAEGVDILKRLVESENPRCVVIRNAFKLQRAIGSL